MNKVTLLEFYSEWCGACKAQDPILEGLERDMGDKVDIIRVGITNNQDIFEQFNVDATPTLFIVKNDNILKKYVGVTSRNELESVINSEL